MKDAADKIAKANDLISEARMALTVALAKMLVDKSHTFKKYDVYVTDEENCTRELIKSCTFDTVTFADDTTMDIGDIGLDDLQNVADMVYAEMIEK